MILLLAALLSSSALDLENAGLLPEAGEAWAEQGSVPGQARILCRMLEEALYAGEGDRALLMIETLAPFCGDTALVDYWTARAAWTAGLSQLAAGVMDGIESDDPWLLYRARGTAALYRNAGEEAGEWFLLSLAAADTARKGFWSAVDLCLALLETGDRQGALALSGLLLYNYPGDAIAPVLHGHCLQASGEHGAAAAILAGIDAGNPAVSRIAERLMEGYER
ncbi:MAG TPA: hypothetical protein PK907_05180 [Candidatus Sabulitectum sp.]|nr:hypothetical protein [Candidatus Sabulitectum sp.]